MYGIVTSLFSGLAFLGVIVSLFLQREDLKLTREELKLTREELRLQRIELERSARSQEKSEEISRDIAKLNGLSSLLDYSMNNKNYQSSIDEFLGKGGAEEIKNDIKNIVSKLK